MSGRGVKRGAEGERKVGPAAVDYDGDAEDTVVEFGWEEEAKPELSGRRLKLLKEKKKKNKPGTFGTL